jgi:phthalate 4,5-cis-dihydrodiol dehydrogenase
MSAEIGGGRARDYQRPLRLGLVGLGVAGGVMAAAARSHPHIQVAAAADPNTELRGRLERDFNVPTFPDLCEMLKGSDVEAVYIATPHQLHRDDTVAAASAAKHVLVEKPMALSLTDCDEMIASADASGVALVVGYTHAFDPAVQLIRDTVASGRLGRLSMVAQWNYTDFLYRPRGAAALDPSRGGGILLNQLPHQVDVARYIVGEPVRTVRAVAPPSGGDRSTVGAYSALVEFTSGAVASMVYSGNDHFQSDELHGWVSEGGYARGPAHGSARRAVRGISAAQEEAARSHDLGYGGRPWSPPGHQPHFGELVVTCERGDLRCGLDEVILYGDEGMTALPVRQTEWVPGWGDALEELRQAVRGGVPPTRDGRFGRATVAACLALAESARERSDIRLSN